MDIYIADHNRINTDILPVDAYLDLDIGGSNDFELRIPYETYKGLAIEQGGYIYSPGTEIGGLLNEFSSDTSKKEVTFRGKTFRGMLEDKFVEPPSGSDYLVVNGDVNACLTRMCGTSFYNGLFEVASTVSHKTVTNVKVGRYYSYLEALAQVLGSVNSKLLFTILEESREEGLIGFFVFIEADSVVNYSDDVENSQDGLIDFSISKAPAVPYSHVLALGKGELKDRLVVRLEMTSDGSYREIVSFPDSARVLKFEDSNSESKEELIKESIKRLKEANPTDKQSISLKEPINIWLGDIVSGRDYITGIYVSEPITKIIYEYKDGQESFGYTIGGHDNG